jgi:WD40 repeat protein
VTKKHRVMAIALVVAAVAASACTFDPGQDDLPRVDGRSIRSPGLLFVEMAEGTMAIDPRGASTAWSGRDVLPAPHFSRLFAIRDQGSSSRLVTLDPATGIPQAAMAIPSGLSGRVASPSGRSLAMVRGGDDATIYAPADRDKTRIVVARPASGRVQVFDLVGNFEPEAFSTDDRRLFMIEHLQEGRYRVRMMSIRSGRILPAGRLTKFAPDSMRGTGRVQVYAPEGDVLYTLYTKQPPNDAHRAIETIHNHGMVHAFVHVLNLEEGWAHCVDLPMPFGMGTQPASMLAVSPDGEYVYAGDGRRIAAVDTQRLEVDRIATADVIEDGTSRILAGPDDRLYFGGGSKLSVLDTRTLSTIDEFDLSGRVRALGITPDGDELFVGDADEVVALDSASGEEIASIAVPAPSGLVYWAPSGR